MTPPPIMTMFASVGNLTSVCSEVLKRALPLVAARGVSLDKAALECSRRWAGPPTAQVQERVKPRWVECMIDAARDER